MERAKNLFLSLCSYLFALMVITSLLCNIVLYIQNKGHIEMIIHLQGEIQGAQETTLKVLDKYTDKHGYRKID